jgi:hypothetical protein
MRYFFAILSNFFVGLYRFALEVVTRLTNKISFEPVFEIMGMIRAQVDKVASVFAKAPCSATGGTA